MANLKIKIIYFDGKGRAEAARLILQAAGKEFEDIRFKDDADWLSYKPKTPFGQAPVLELDGKLYGQSQAIKNFLAREFGYYGNTNLESLQIDQVSQLIEDLVQKAAHTFELTDEVAIAKEVERIKAEVSPTFLNYFEKLLQQTGTGYFVGNRITLADIEVFDFVTGLLRTYVDVNDKFPLLQKNVELVRTNEKFAPYLASRTVTPW